MRAKNILIVKNITREGPGLFQEIITERRISSTVVDLDQGQTLTPVENFGAVIVLGGPDSANDQNEKMTTELERVRETLEAKIPYLGICLGLQVLVKAADGTVIKSPTKEVGFLDPDGNGFTVDLTEKGKQDALLQGLKESLRVFHLHGETVELTESMQLLGTGKWCRNQIVKVGPNAYGLQCHFELTPEMFEIWINEDPDLLKLNKEELQSNFREIKDQYTEVGKRLFGNFLKIADL